MRPEIPVFAAEVADGLRDLVLASASVAYMAPAEPFAPGEAPPSRERARAAASQSGAGTALAGLDDPDLYPVRDVLVSTGWNRNKDVFDPREVWAARHTPVYKPFNLNHVQTDIVGVIVASRAVDWGRDDLAEDLAIDALPPRFHVLNESVIYRGIGGEARATLVEETIAEIEAGGWFVSMEAFFRGFDYAVIGPDGEHRTIARTAESAFLTKHLRQYGGDGTYVDASTGRTFELGRVLRQITFCGKGLVRKPANPESVILAAASFAATPADPGYLRPVTQPAAIQEAAMADTALTDFTAELKKGLAEVTNHLTSAAGDQIRSLESQVASLTAEKATLVASAATLEAKVAELSASLESARAATVAAEAEAARAAADLAAAVEKVAVATAGTRKALALTAGATPEKADEVVANLAALDDAAYASTLAGLALAWNAPAPAPKAPREKRAIDDAEPEATPALSVASDQSQSDAVANFFNQA